MGFMFRYDSNYHQMSNKFPSLNKTNLLLTNILPKKGQTACIPHPAYEKSSVNTYFLYINPFGDSCLLKELQISPYCLPFSCNKNILQQPAVIVCLIRFL